MFCPGQRIGPVAVVLARHPEHRRIRSGLLRVALGELAVVADQRDEASHRRTAAARLVDVADGHARGQRGVPIGDELGERRLVGDEGRHVVRMGGHEGQGIDRATAAGEHVDRPAAGRGDDPVEVVGVLLRGRLGRRLGLQAAFHATRVVGHDPPIREVAGERPEAARAHRRADEQQGPRAAVAVGRLAHVVGDAAARSLEGAGRGIGHGIPPGASAGGEWR